MFDDDRWYPRLADLPGMTFGGSPGIDRAKLRGSDARPRRREYDFGVVLEWPERNGESNSPASAHRQDEWAGLSTKRLAKNVWESLELPGTLGDWHFTLQDAVSELWRRRHTEPAALRLCEQFARIDLEMARARPEAFALEPGRSDQGYVAVRAFDLLVRMYRAMDDLPRAIHIARHAETWGNQVLGKAADEMQALLDAGL